MAGNVDYGDYVAISEVKARYCRAMDTKDWTAFADVFTEDFELDTTAAGGSSVIRGRDAAVSAIRSWVEGAQTVHQVHSPEMRIDGDVADVIWAMQDRVIWSSVRRPRPEMGGHTGFGHYHERYIRSAGRSVGRSGGQWRISKQRLTRLIVEFHPP
jgi:hypothetical protein